MPTTTDSIRGECLAELVELSHHLGEEWRDYAIIGEGNTSARIGDGTFWIKASGSNLRTIQPNQFVQVDCARVVAALNSDLSDDDVTHVLNDARVDPTVTARPSVETFFHGLLYDLTDAQFIGHTHPVAVNTILCSSRATDLLRHIMPDVIIVCGLHSVFVPYVDPGVPLSREIRARVQDFIRAHDEAPRTIYLQNHGLIALGQSAKQVQNITAMAVKNARVLAATYALGGPHFLDENDNVRIETRPDEDVRRAQFK